MKILVTGGAGFIGSAVIRLAVSRGHAVVNLDALTYAACLTNLASVADSSLYAFEQADIRDQAALDKVFSIHQPDIVMHLAAESHVDRSIDSPSDISSRPISLGPSTCWRLRANTGSSLASQKTFAFTIYRQTKSSARCPAILQHCSRRTRPMIHAALIQHQRPSGAGVACDIWPACRTQQLFQQLWALSLPRKVNTSGYLKRARGERSTDLWRW